MTTFDEEFEAATGPLHELGERVTGLLQEILRDSGVGIHSIDFRVKAKSSASRKLAAGGDNFASVSELHDLLGVRVITYFVDQVDIVGGIVSTQFETDPKRSKDKSTNLDPNQFGYLSLHYVVSISKSRGGLPEWTRFANLNFELQIRSILQHSWAEIEHDLGYKSLVAIPSQVRRRFSRLAGLLELADDEFLAIREGLENHARTVDVQVKAGKETPLDRDSVASLVLSSPLIRALDLQISNKAGVSLSGSVSDSYAATRTRELKHLGLRSTADVLEALERDGVKVAEFAALWFTRTIRKYREPSNEVTPGITLFYLYLHLSALRGDEAVSDLGIFRGAGDEDIQAFRTLHNSIFGRA